MIRYKKEREVYKNGNITRETTWHYTRGEFDYWMDYGGMFGFIYAVVSLRRSALYIPAHDLHPEDRAQLLKDHPRY